MPVRESYDFNFFSRRYNSIYIFWVKSLNYKMFKHTSLTAPTLYFMPYIFPVFSYVTILLPTPLVSGFPILCHTKKKVQWWVRAMTLEMQNACVRYFFINYKLYCLKIYMLTLCLCFIKHKMEALKMPTCRWSVKDMF